MNQRKAGGGGWGKEGLNGISEMVKGRRNFISIENKKLSNDAGKGDSYNRRSKKVRNPV